MKKKLLIQETGTKILIIGVDGMLGHKLHEQLSKSFKNIYFTSRNSNLNKNKYYIKNINVINTKAVINLIKKIKPTYVINCAGVIKQKLKNKTDKNLFLVNTKFPIFLDKYSEKLKYRHIHFSTDCVFDGKRGSYTEKDKTNARDIYGISKLKSESKINKNTLILRTSIIGHEKNQSTKSLLNWFLCQKKNCLGFKKAYFTGVTTLELSKIISHIILKKKFVKGLYNLSSKKISKFKLLELINIKYKKKINIVSDLSLKIDRSLIGKKFEKKFKIHTKSWKIQIDEMYKNYKLKKKIYNYL